MFRRSVIIASFFLAESAIAAPLPTDPHFCFIQYADGQVVNLDRLCGKGAIAPSATEVAPVPSTATSTSSGKCTFSSDRDSRGRLCGGRASTRRRGGR